MIEITRDSEDRIILRVNPEVLRVIANELEEEGSTAWQYRDSDGNANVAIFRQPL